MEMKISSFEDFVAWQKSKELNILLFALFKYCKDFSFRDQLLRVSLSIMNNIAEGYERNGNKEFRNFLFIAKGSCAEVRSMLYLALEARYVSETEFKEVYALSLQIAKMLSGLIKTL